jgi:hypothetical protein
VRKIIKLVSDEHLVRFSLPTDESKMKSILEEMDTDFRLFRINEGNIEVA